MTDSHDTSTSPATWLSAHLHYAPPWDRLLIEAVNPFVSEMVSRRLVNRFFFIRYWARGPHIRLRLRGNTDVLHSVVRVELEHFFDNYFLLKPSTIDTYRRQGDSDARAQEWLPNNTIRFVEYEPEVERYGGVGAIALAEKQFCLSSHIVLQILAENSDPNYDRVLGIAIKLHIIFAATMGMDLEEACEFFKYLCKQWFATTLRIPKHLPRSDVTRLRPKVLKAFENSFAAQQSLLNRVCNELLYALAGDTDLGVTALQEWAEGMRDIADAYQTIGILSPRSCPEPEGGIIKSCEHEKAWPILASLVHMTNNRLGIWNRDEAYLGYLIYRALEGLSRKEE